MSNEQTAPAAARARPRALGPVPEKSRSVHVERARRLLISGLIGGLAATVVALIALGLAYGAPGVAGGALGAALVLVFYTVGQLVMVAFADAGARTLLMVSMTSYTGRVVVLGLVLLAYSNNRDSFPALVPMAVFLSAIAVVVGWLAVEIWTFSRLRIGIYDTEYADSPAEEDGR